MESSAAPLQHAACLPGPPGMGGAPMLFLLLAYLMRTVHLAFIGQCHTVGYPGVPADAAFPQVCRQALQSRRPGARISLELEEYQHPQQLGDAVRRALRTRPRVVVIEVIGWLTVKGTNAVDLSRLPSGVRSAVQRVRHFRHISHAVASRMPAQLLHNASQFAGALIGSGVRHTRTTPAEYEQQLDKAIRTVREVPDIDCVIQGPGAPNLTLDSRHFPADIVERYRAVQLMARRVADAHDVLYVDRWDTVASGFFSSDSIRPSAQGHSVWGHLLADHLIAAGLV